MGLNILSFSVRVQASRLACSTVRVHLLLIEHFDFLRILHIDLGVIIYLLLLTLGAIIVSV